jgi:hypothetical protein
VSLAANSYGSAAGVASYVPRYANASLTFDNTVTRPRLSQVEAFLDQISSLVNAVLASNGFKIPITQADARLAITVFVEQEVAAIAEGINGSGRFGPTTKTPGKSRFQIIMEDISAFVLEHADGFENLGAERTQPTGMEILTRGADAAGKESFPIFQREAFGNVFENWTDE